MQKQSILFIAVSVLLSGGCMSPQYHAQAVNAAQGENLTVGKVQREIRPGMTNAQVAETLGSPNIVSTDESGHEVWVYDKISTLSVVSASSGGLLLGAAGAGNSVAGLGGFGFNSGAGAASTSQRTLTIIVKFDGRNRVKSTAYHYSSF